MDVSIYGWMINLLTMAMAMVWLHVNIAVNTASTEAINSTATAGPTLAATAVTAAAGPLLGK